MRKKLVVLLSSVVLAALVSFLIGFNSSCGSTGGGSSVAEIAAQFVSLSCAPGGGRCLTLSAPNSVPADGKTRSGFTAILLDGSGNPIDNVSLCFHFEDPDVAIIFEPTDNCGLTGLDGRVSGQFRDGTRPGSFTLVVEAPPGFGLQARARISFNGVSPAPGQKGDLGATCQTDGDCNTAPVKLFCTFNDVCFPGGTTCQGGNGDGGCCTSGVECVSQTCDTTRGRCVPSTGGGVGAPCATNSNCNTDGGLFCTFQDICFSGAPSCQPKAAGGGCCTNDSECASGTCNTSSNQCTAKNGGAGSPCIADGDCNPSLFCSFGDTCFPGAAKCTLKNSSGQCCTVDTECANKTCDLSTNPGTCAAPTPSPSPAVPPPATPTPPPATPTPPPATPTPPPGGVGATCVTDGQCQSGLICSIGDCGNVPPANTCQTKKVNGQCCTIPTECISGACNSNGTCATAGSIGTPCTSGAQCTSGVCSSTFPGCSASACCEGNPGDPCSPNGPNAECLSGTCTGGACT